jgi:hypothetical protein
VPFVDTAAALFAGFHGHSEVRTRVKHFTIYNRCFHMTVNVD